MGARLVCLPILTELFQLITQSAQRFHPDFNLAQLIFNEFGDIITGPLPPLADLQDLADVFQ